MVKEQLTKPLVFKTCHQNNLQSSEWSPMVKWNDNFSKLYPTKKWFTIFIWEGIAKQKPKSNVQAHAWTNLLENTKYSIMTRMYDLSIISVTFVRKKL